jgi:hypothetical protein
MSYRIELEIPGLPKMANPSGARSTHWRYAMAEVSKWRALVGAAIAASRTQLPRAPCKKFSLTLTRMSSSEPDYDGLVRGFKSVVDGLKAAGVIADDKLSNTGAWDCRWERCKPKQGRIRVIVEAL